MLIFALVYIARGKHGTCIEKGFNEFCQTVTCRQKQLHSFSVAKYVIYTFNNALHDTAIGKLLHYFKHFVCWDNGYILYITVVQMQYVHTFLTEAIFYVSN